MNTVYAEQSKEYTVGSQLLLSCTSLFAEGFTNKSRMKNAKVSPDLSTIIRLANLLIPFRFNRPVLLLHW